MEKKYILQEVINYMKKKNYSKKKTILKGLKPMPIDKYIMLRLAWEIMQE